MGWVLCGVCEREKVSERWKWKWEEAVALGGVGAYRTTPATASW